MLNPDLKMTYKWVPELHPEGDGLIITEHLNDVAKWVVHASEEAIKTSVITYLRNNGYIVIEPEEAEGA